jgi:hypothetical protein
MHWPSMKAFTWSFDQGNVLKGFKLVVRFQWRHLVKLKSFVLLLPVVKLLLGSIRLIYLGRNLRIKIENGHVNVLFMGISTYKYGF